MMNWFLGHTTRFKAIVSHASVYNLTSMWGVTEELWFPEWDLKGTPWTQPRGLREVVAAHLREELQDARRWSRTASSISACPIGEGLQLFTTLQRQGVPSRMVYFPDEGHWINKPANSGCGTASSWRGWTDG